MSLLYRGRKFDLKSIRIGQELRLDKKDTELGGAFERTFLGNDNGAVAQYRGPYCTHIREYLSYYIIHRDRVDPRRDAWGHLVKDAPDDLAGLLIGSASAAVAGKITYDNRKNLSKNAVGEASLVSVVVGLAGFVFGKWLFSK